MQLPPTSKMPLMSIYGRRLLTPLLALYPAHLISVAVIYLSAVVCTPQVALPIDPAPWWELFDVSSEEEIWAVCGVLLDVYNRWAGDLDWLAGGASSLVHGTVWRRAAELRLPATKEEVRQIIVEQQ